MRGGEVEWRRGVEENRGGEDEEGRGEERSRGGGGGEEERSRVRDEGRRE